MLCGTSFASLCWLNQSAGLCRFICASIRQLCSGIRAAHLGIMAYDSDSCRVASMILFVQVSERNGRAQAFSRHYSQSGSSSRTWPACCITESRQADFGFLQIMNRTARLAAAIHLRCRHGSQFGSTMQSAAPLTYTRLAAAERALIDCKDSFSSARASKNAHIYQTADTARLHQCIES